MPHATRRDARRDDHYNIRTAVPFAHALCDGRELTGRVERKLALYIMLYGRLDFSQEKIFDGDRLKRASYVFTPPEGGVDPVAKKTIHLVGPLSAMFSRFYLGATSTQRGQLPQQIYARSTPGALALQRT